MIALVYRNSMVYFFFPGLDIKTYPNFQKTLPPAVLATIRGSQPLVAISNHSFCIVKFGIYMLRN